MSQAAVVRNVTRLLLVGPLVLMALASIAEAHRSGCHGNEA